MLTPAAFALTVLVVATAGDEPTPAARNLLDRLTDEQAVLDLLGTLDRENGPWESPHACDAGCQEQRWREAFPDYEAWRERILKLSP